MTKYLYKGLPEEAKKTLRASMLAMMERPENLYHQSYGSEAGRARNNAHRDAAWERLKKQRLKEVEDSVASADAECRIAGFVLPKGEEVEVDLDALPKGRTRDQARERFASACEDGLLYEVKPYEKKPEEKKPDVQPVQKK